MAIALIAVTIAAGASTRQAAGRAFGMPLELGISSGSSVLMALGFAVAMLTYGTGRTNLLAGVVHLVLLATWVFSIFAP